LKVPADAVELLGVQPDLTLNAALFQILHGQVLPDERSADRPDDTRVDVSLGVLAMLSDPKSDRPRLDARLSELWKLLLPQPVRERLLAGKIERLTILPEGSLGLLPFEVLVVSRGAKTQYLVDIAPPIAYGPSAAVLLSLARRPVVP